jgi:ABC-2 type transport system ATP-binding protein
MGRLAVELDQVTKQYGDFTAVSALSLTVAQGAIYGILGPNGAGKTTTLRMLNDIIAPDAGRIRLLGELAPGRAAARRIGYLPEERGLYPKMRVSALLRFFGELRGLAGREATRRADAWLQRLGVADWKLRKVQDLSKGMQQKIQFITAVIHEPDLLILDEPWSGLDPINAEVLRDIVLEQKRAGRTILFSTHLMEQAEKLCDDVFIIARGKKVLEGPLAAIKRAAAGDRLVALAFADDAAAARAEAALADRTLVAARRARKDHVEIELCAGAAPHALLSRLVAADASLRRFELIEPSLHQIFVDRVGADAATPAAPAAPTAPPKGRRA